jgi:hypothetical protein
MLPYGLLGHAQLALWVAPEPQSVILMVTQPMFIPSPINSKTG